MAGFFMIQLLIAGCSQEPVEVHYGSDECAHCKMMITDPQFAAQMVTEKGKAYTFDAIECLAVYHREHQQEFSGARLWVNDYSHPGNWLNARQAQYVQSEVINSPMGASLLALPDEATAKEHIAKKPGQLLQWQAVSQVKMHNGMQH